MPGKDLSMLFDPEKYPSLHNRTINVSTYDYDTDAIAVEGRLTDNRYVKTYSLFGESRPPGIVHDMIVRMIIRGQKLVIEAVEVEMITAPDPNCAEAESSLQALKGEKITPGFTAKVQRLVGRSKGCAHLVSLCRAMASAAVQGGYASIARKEPKERNLSVRNLENAMDTCHIWRSDGPMVQRLKAALKKEG